MERPDWSPEVIVVGTDGSERSLHAAHVAASMARKNAAKLYLVTVVRPPEGWWGVVGSPPPAETMTRALERAQAEILDTVTDAIDLSGIDWETLEEIGDAAGALAEVCKTLNADVLVVGRRGAGLVERLMMGSVADRVAHFAPCPVLVVP